MTPQQRYDERMRRIDAVVAATAREAGVSAGTVRYLWWHHGRWATAVVRIGEFGSRRKPRPARGEAVAVRHEVVLAPVFLRGLAWWERVCEITPKGRQILWRLHERLAEAGP